MINTGFNHNPLRWESFQGSALTDMHHCVHVCIFFIFEPVCSNRGLGQFFHVTQRSRRRWLSRDLTQKAGRKQMAVVVDGRCSHGLAGWPGDITRLQTLSLSPASRGINKLIRPAAHMGSQSRAAVLGGCYWNCLVCLMPHL